METLNDVQTVIDSMNVICHWSSYKGSHCRRNVHNNKLCPMHLELIKEYRIASAGTLCDTSQMIKICPRSYQHLKSVMRQLKNDNCIVDVIHKDTVGGLTEEADISNETYIQIISDDTKYYYNCNNSKNHVKNLKIVLKQYCVNTAVVSIGIKDIKGTKCLDGTAFRSFCEQCYKKQLNVPKISVIKALT